MNWLFFLLIIFCCCPCRSFAQGTYTAASCNQSDVDAVINGPTHTAVDGDVIQIPAGTCTWTNGIVIPVGIGITIIGAGTADPHNPSGSGSTTTIIDNYTGSPRSFLFYFTPSVGASTSRISSLYLTPQSGLSTNSLDSPMGFRGTCTTSGCPNIRVDHVVFPVSPSWGNLVLQSATMVIADNVFGVLDHNSLYLDDPNFYYEFVNFNYSAWQGIGQYGDNSWASPDSFGTAQALYVETNYLEMHQGNIFPLAEAEAGFSQEAQGGGRVVCRFNTGVGLRSMCANHGTETNGRPRGGRQMEFYKNSMSCPDATYTGCWGSGMLFGPGVRSGSLIAMANTYTGKGMAAFSAIAENRILMAIPGLPGISWGPCDGTGSWDNNTGVTVQDTGTMTAVNASTWSVTDNTKTWTASQWVQTSGAPYSIHDLTTGEGSEIWGNGTNSLSGHPFTTLDFSVGDSYQILHTAGSCLDQPSRIGGSLFSGPLGSVTPTNASGGWINQTLDPVYEAADTNDQGFPGFGGVSSNTQRIIANRDYYDEVSQSAQTSPTSPFNGTVGTGYGILANRPSTCTPAVGYWATDQGNWNNSGSGGQGQLFVCTATNTWTLSYTPFIYPHTLATITGDAVAAVVGSPSTQLIILASLAMMLMWGLHIVQTPLINDAGRNDSRSYSHVHAVDNDRQR